MLFFYYGFFFLVFFVFAVGTAVNEKKETLSLVHKRKNYLV